MKSVPLKAFPRGVTRRAGVKKLRDGGRVPAVIYGRNVKPQNLELNRVEIDNLIHHSATENVLVDLSVESDARGKRLALVQDVQHHPLRGNVLHVDLHEVAEDEKITILVPVEPTGDAVGSSFFTRKASAVSGAMSSRPATWVPVPTCFAYTMRSPAASQLTVMGNSPTAKVLRSRGCRSGPMRTRRAHPAHAADVE